jgi:hypothetical protein
MLKVIFKGERKVNGPNEYRGIVLICPPLKSYHDCCITAYSKQYKIKFHIKNMVPWQGNNTSCSTRGP